MTTDIGIDLGSYKTVIFSQNKTVLELPSVVTVDSETFEPVYYANKAFQTIGRTPDSLECVRPIEHGLISDIYIAEKMLNRYMQKAFGQKIVRPKIMACVPTGVTEIQYHNLTSVIERSGGRNITVVESPLLSAVSLGIDFSVPHGTMIVDIGAGTTDIAVITMGGIAQSQSFKTGSFDFDDVIIKSVRREFNILIGALTAEKIKKQVGTVVQRPVEVAMTAKGRDIFSGLPQSFEITSNDVLKAVSDTALSICSAIKSVIETTDPDLVADVMNDGIYLTGGGSLINGMAEFISEYVGTKVHMVNDPAHSVVRGAAAALKNPKVFKDVDLQYRALKDLIVE